MPGGRRTTAENGARMPGGVAGAVVAAGAMALLERIATGIEDLIRTQESEPDLDTTYVVGGTIAAASAYQIQLPRTVHHAELTLSAGLSDNTQSVALFEGQVDVTSAGQRHNKLAPGPSGSIAASNGNAVTVRDNLGQVGILTVYVTGACTFVANVRVRSLDKTQTRAKRT